MVRGVNKVDIKKKTLLVGLSLVVVLGIGIVSSDAYGQKPTFNALAAYEKIEQTEAGLMKYKSDNKGKLGKISSENAAKDEILVTVTFSKYLSEGQVVRLTNDYNLRLDHITARAIEGDTGLRATMQLSPTKGCIYDKATFDDMVSGHKASFKGFIEAVAYVPNEKLRDLASDNRIFLVDPSADNSIIENPESKHMPGIFWQLEDFDLIDE